MFGTGSDVMKSFGITIRGNSPMMAVFLLVAGCCSFVACAGEHLSRDITLKQTASDPGDLPTILRKADRMPFLKSLIIIQNGETVIEKYFNGGHAEKFIDIKSASKSILSALLGIALQEHHIRSLNQKVIEFFPEYVTEGLDPGVQDLKLRHLITMRSGLKVKENAKAYQQLYQSSDWISHILHLPFKRKPGKQFNYQSFNTHLLSAILTKATRMSTLEYATGVLFAPLDITKVLWDRDPNGVYIGGWGMSLKAQDMAKFGCIYLNGGYYEGKKILSSEWIRESTVDRTGSIGTYYSGWNKTYGYGYLWWIKRIEGRCNIPFALGHGGQRIAFIPEAKAVMVVQADPNIKPSASHKNHRAIDALLFDDISSYLLK